MIYDNAWVGINKNKKLDRIQLLHLSQKDRDKIVAEIENISELAGKKELKNILLIHYCSRMDTILIWKSFLSIIY